MNANLFRKSSIDRVNSPEELNDYIRVASPGVWIILGAIALFLIGVVIWGIWGNIETTAAAPVIVKSGSAVCYVDDISTLEEGMEVRIDGKDGTIESIKRTPLEITSDYDPYFLYISSFTPGSFAYPVTLDIEGLEDGVYSAEIVKERINPIYFIIH